MVVQVVGGLALAVNVHIDPGSWKAWQYEKGSQAGLSFLFFSCGNAVLPRQVAELLGPLRLSPPWLFMPLKAQLQPP